jgi:hypothetical protein
MPAFVRFKLCIAMVTGNENSVARLQGGIDGVLGHHKEAVTTRATIHHDACWGHGLMFLEIIGEDLPP